MPDFHRLCRSLQLNYESTPETLGKGNNVKVLEEKKSYKYKKSSATIKQQYRTPS